jgi:hypothetical protein
MSVATLTKNSLNVSATSFWSFTIIERCVGGPKQKDFWPTIKSFITNKGSYFENNIILTDDDRIINDIFDFVKKGDLHNYADDNTLSYGSNSVDDVIEILEEQSDILIKWFTENSKRLWGRQSKAFESSLRWQWHIGYYLTDSSNLQLF